MTIEAKRCRNTWQRAPEVVGSSVWITSTRTRRSGDTTLDGIQGYQRRTGCTIAMAPGSTAIYANMTTYRLRRRWKLNHDDRGS
jgi:hypothetical protein